MDLIVSKDQQLTIWEFSTKLSKSAMIPMVFRSKPEDIFVTILYGNELGISPIMALNSICVIQGQVTLKVQTMNAIVRSKAPEAIISIKQDHDAKKVWVTASRNKLDVPYESFWDMDKAKLMGLSTKNNWIVQPMNMLKARALSDALRTVFPDLLLGLYSSEEMEDLPPIVNQQALTDMINKDFPVPEIETIVGDEYRVQNGKFRSKQLKELSIDEIAEYREDLLKRSTTKKQWEVDLIGVFTEYLKMNDPAIEKPI